MIALQLAAESGIAQRRPGGANDRLSGRVELQRSDEQRVNRFLHFG